MVPFNKVPSDIAVPFWWGEVDESAASSPSDAQRTVLIGQRLSTGTVAAGVPVPVSSEGQAASYFGKGSMLHLMVKALKRNDGFPDLWCVAADDNGAGTAATCAITFSGSATAAGTIYLYTHNQRIAVGITSGMTATQQAAAMAAAVTAYHTANGDVPFTAASADAVCTLTFRHKGLSGNCPVWINYLGAAGGEYMPTGCSVTPAGDAFTGGATNPDYTAVLAALNEDPADYIGLGFRDSTNKALVATEVADRWDPERQLYGHAFYAQNDTYANLIATAWDSRWATLFGYNDSPTPEYVWVAAMMGAVSQSLKIDPARPVHGLSVVGVIPPRNKEAFSVTEQDLLLKAGVTPYALPGGNVVTSRCVTTYKTNSFGVPDKALRDVTTLTTSWRYMRSLRAEHQRLFGRCKIVDNGTLIPPGSAATTPDQIRAATVAHYIMCETQLGWVENSELFAEKLVVERDGTDPNRVNMLSPPDYANPLYVMAVNNQFRLQYQKAA